MKKVFIFCAVISIAALNCSTPQSKNDRLAKASREDKNGWVYVHLEGSPSDIGYQHGSLLAPEIDSALQMMSYFLQNATKRDWNFYRTAAQKFFWNKLDKEYKDEINGIVEGLQSKGKKYDSLDITALNAWMELAWYY